MWRHTCSDERSAPAVLAPKTDTAERSPCGCEYRIKNSGTPDLSGARRFFRQRRDKTPLRALRNSGGGAIGPADSSAILETRSGRLLSGSHAAGAGC